MKNTISAQKWGVAGVRIIIINETNSTSDEEFIKLKNYIETQVMSRIRENKLDLKLNIENNYPSFYYAFIYSELLK